MPAPRHLVFLGAAMLLALGGGCATTPVSAFALSPETEANRTIQTRRFDNVAEPALMAACLGVLQDIGFTLESSETGLGVIAASRKLTSRRPLGAGEITRDLGWTVLTGYLGAAFLIYDAATGIK